MSSRQRIVETWVGLFMLLGIVGLIFLAFKVSGLTQQSMSDGYTITASFENIGGLKARAPVQMGGVKIGRVTSIVLDKKTYRAVVSMLVFDSFDNIPNDSRASILTQGLLGSNYVGVTPGYAQAFYKQGGVIQDTSSAMILENLIGQFLYGVNDKKGK